ncbi:hypothetical protein EV586_103215 [Tumebacillus sp. BK434]|uniref:hypothetical protein n=1 Tax=Tumebacillus sp. BK434 TaxID=2512169 RepID=UPI00104BE2FB|nr:hypothetical protein [Tumebacillus sp. BK434]TCP55562.1 hypothetical protein EV586_103215 [Tumebacillus sp. BK434]
MSFVLTGWMMYTMWAVLGLMTLDLLMGVYKSMKSNSCSLGQLSDFLGGVMTYVFPLLILASLNKTDIDPTGGWILLVLFYLTGIGVIWKLLLGIKSKL